MPRLALPSLALAALALLACNADETPGSLARDTGAGGGGATAGGDAFDPSRYGAVIIRAAGEAPCETSQATVSVDAVEILDADDRVVAVATFTGLGPEGAGCLPDSGDASKGAADGAGTELAPGTWLAVEMSSARLTFEPGDKVRLTLLGDGEVELVLGRDLTCAAADRADCSHTLAQGVGPGTSIHPMPNGAR